MLMLMLILMKTETTFTLYPIGNALFLHQDPRISKDLERNFVPSESPSI